MRRFLAARWKVVGFGPPLKGRCRLIGPPLQSPWISTGIGASDPW